MKDLDKRLRDAGPDADRALLEAASVPPELPAGFADDVRRKLERRLETGARPRRRLAWRLALAGSLVAGTALAVPIARRMMAPDAAPPAPVEPTPVRAPEPRLQPVEPVPSAPAEPEPSPRRRPRDRAPERAAELPTMPSWPASVAVEEKPAPPPPAPPAPALRITHAGRHDGTLTLSKPGGEVLLHLDGAIEGTRVALDVANARITGHIGSLTVWVIAHGERAGGTIGGHNVSFDVYPTRNGDLVRGDMPGYGVRLELDTEKLSWLPGCERDLPGRGTASRTFEGACKNEPRAHVELPEAVLALPRIVRLVLLAMLLPDRDPVFDAEPPWIFGPRAR